MFPKESSKIAFNFDMDYVVLSCGFKKTWEKYFDYMIPKNDLQKFMYLTLMMYIYW